MATCIWIGNARRTAQVNTLTPTASNSQTYTITIGGKAVTYTADASATVAEITAGLVVAFAASSEPEFREATATDGTTVVLITAITAGVPFTQTSSATGGGALVTATTTDSSGPNHYGIAANWSGNAVPVSADDVIFGAGSIPVLYDMDQSAVALASLVFHAGVGQVGLPDYTGTYRQYRPAYLTFGTVTSVDIGLGDGNGSPLIRLNTGSNASTVKVWKTGSSSDRSLPPLQLRGSHADNVLRVYSGTVGLAVSPGETANFPTITSGYLSSPASDVTIIAGTGLSAVTTLIQTGGTVDLSSSVTTWNLTDGTATLRGTATLGTLNLDGGTFLSMTTGTITTLSAGGDGTFDRSRGQGSQTITNCTATAGCKIIDPNKTIVWSNGIKLTRAGITSGNRSAGVILDLGEHLTLTPSAY